VISEVYLEYSFIVKPLSLGNEILIAELAYVGFESFLEDYQGLKAYIQKKEWNKNILEEIQILDSNKFQITYSKKEIEQVNWNAAWEKKFHPIEVDQKCIVRAPFHSKANVDYEIVIEPKMSFGTGHHETTYMMLQYMLETDFQEKTVLDMGCGTAVLAILAEFRGASKIDAIDIDSWCYKNSLENIERNNCKNIKTFLGDVSLLENKKYQIIIANINRNILLKDMESYCFSLENEGQLFLSGFYNEDLNLIIATCTKFNLTFVDKIERNNWIAAKFKK
jgi:ribosomal protein L11 methyltransferase